MGTTNSADFGEGPTIEEAVRVLALKVTEKGGSIEEDLKTHAYCVYYRDGTRTRVTMLQFHTPRGHPYWGAMAAPVLQ